MKRHISEILNSNKKRKNEIYVHANDINNYLLNDTLVDYIRVKEHSNENISEEESFLINQSTSFKKNVVEYIKTKHNVITVSELITYESVNKTITLMKKGTPIIHSAPVINETNKTKGIIDLLVRSDYLHIIGEHTLKPEEVYAKATKISSKKSYHYVVIDITFSNIPFRKDGIHILNNGLYPFYKARNIIYNDAISIIQGYKSNYSFIFGKKSYNNKLGIVNYNKIDISYISTTNRAIKWVKNVKKDGMNWEIGSRKELYPNMKVDSFRWNSHKKCISNDIGEISSLWNCGVKNRNNAIKRGVKSLYSPFCNSKILKIKGRNGIIIDKILSINRQSEHVILPLTINNNYGNWRHREQNEFFVDFETINNHIFDTTIGNDSNEECNNLIFIIGVSWFENNNIIYNKFICNTISKEEEFRIISEFLTFIRKNGKPKLYFWSAEEKFWNSAKKRHTGLEWNVEWVDLLKVFIMEPIVIKNCLDFKLKHIASEMYKNKLINTKIESDCVNGMTAMINAFKVYNDNTYNIQDNPVIKDIVRYNNFDCNVLCDILYYLRINH